MPLLHQPFRVVICLTLMGVIGSGCGYIRLGKHRPPAGRKIVVHVGIEQNDGVADSDIIDGLATYADNFGSFDDKPLLNLADVGEDKKRVVAAYSDNGYFEAKVEGYRVEEDADDPNLVRVYFKVDEGPATRISEIVYNGLDELPEEAEAARRLRDVRERLPRYTQFEQGEIWNLAEYEATSAAIREALLERGFIYAEVVGTVEVSRKNQTARVVYGIVPGPLTRIQSIQVLGSNIVSTERIMDRVRLEPGEIIDPERLLYTEQDISDLGMFFSVAVKPKRVPLDVRLGEEDYTYENLQALQWDAEVPVTIVVQERPVHEFQAGGGASIDNRRSEFHLLGGYTNRNLFGGQRLLETILKPGWNFQPYFWDTQRQGPGGEASIRFKQPSFVEEYTTLETTADYELVFEDTLIYHEVGGSLGFSRTFFRQLTTRIGYRVVYRVPLDVEEDFVAGQDLTDPGLFTYLEQGLSWDLRDSVLDPRNGGLMSLTIRESLPELGSDADFLHVASDNRGYWQPFGALGFAIRALWAMNVKLSTIDPPIADWITGGGGTDFRGYPSLQMGPITCGGKGPFDNQRSCPDGQELLYPGGNAKALFQFETRVFLPGNFGLVAFVDVGQVWSFLENTDFSELDVAVGPWLRYYTLIGPIGIDLGFLLTGPDPTSPVFHISIGQAF